MWIPSGRIRQKGKICRKQWKRRWKAVLPAGVLADILRAQKAEVVQMVLEGFDQEAYEKAMKKRGL